jgi:nitroreductase
MAILRGVDTYEAILTRRSVPKVTDRAPSRAEIEKLLDAAVRAPTHHLTQPWRFVVLSGDALDELGAAWAAGTEAQGKDASGIAAKTRRAPVILCVIERPHLDNPKCVEVEEHYSIGAAMQNVLLAAHSMGLGAMVRTGPCATFDEVRSHLGVGDDESIAGLIYIGYPAPGNEERPMTRRTPAADITEWRGWS